MDPLVTMINSGRESPPPVPHVSDKGVNVSASDTVTPTCDVPSLFEPWSGGSGLCEYTDLRVDHLFYI